MYYCYTIDETADEPIMLLNGYIGINPDVSNSIMAEQFEREIYALDALGKKRIKIYINSPGGNVMSGMGIYSAILNSKAKVDTYNVGVAASIAAVIFQAGNKRYMADYSKLMFHNPFPKNGTVSRTELGVWKDAIVKMIAGRSGESEETVSSMMDETTWLGAEDAMKRGYCDEVKAGIKAMTPELTNQLTFGENIEDSWTSLMEIINTAIESEKVTKIDNNMPQPQGLAEINNSLGLIAEANEQSALKMINSIKDARDEAEKALAEEKKAHEATKKALADMQNAAEQAKADAEEKRKAELKSAAETMVNDAVTAGKIQDSAKETWIENAVLNFEGTKAQLESIAVNRVAEEIDVNTDPDAAGKTGKFLTNENTGANHTIATTMVDIANANEQK